MAVDNHPLNALSVPEVRTRLRDAVLKGVLSPGSLHSQDGIMEMLSVRRTPFREAVRMVQAEGLVQVLSNGRLKVPDLSVQNFGEIEIARIMLESAAVRIAVPRLDLDAVARLEGLMAQMSHYVATDDFERLEPPHVEFHLGLVAPAGVLFRSAIADLLEKSRRYRWAFVTGQPEFWELRIAEYRSILDAAKDGSVERVATELARHHIQAGRRLVQLMGEVGGPARGEQFDRALRVSLDPQYQLFVSGPA